SLLENVGAMNENGASAAAGRLSKKSSGGAHCFLTPEPLQRTLMDHEENEPKLFSLTEAERARRELEPVLIEAMENRHKVADLDEQLSAVANRILMMGGITIAYESGARGRPGKN